MLFCVRLGKIPRLQSAADNRPSLKIGESGPAVAAVQSLLLDLGYKFPISFKHGHADGVFGAETEKNVKAFQLKSGLVADGVLGAKTLAALDSLVIHNDILEEHDPREFRARAVSDMGELDYT
jgi:peptidoglycan hydrolase-like protein with peptidoglycan-binding domain